MTFVLRRSSPAGPERMWAAVTDFAGHGQHVPLTSVTTDPGAPRVGWGFVARTALGPVGFDDRMVVTDWNPPRRFRVEKRGRLLAGWAEVSVAATAAGSGLIWTQTIRPRVLPQWSRAVTDRIAKPFYARAVAALVADAERPTRSAP